MIWVIEDGDNRIALECDGEKWHTLDDLSNDLKRQAILERLGWRFIRIRGSVFYRNQDETMKWVVEELRNYGISPNYQFENDTCEKEDYARENDLVTSIKRRADQIRMEWCGDSINYEKIEEVIEIANENSHLDSGLLRLNRILEDSIVDFSKEEGIESETLTSMQFESFNPENLVPRLEKVLSTQISQLSINDNDNSCNIDIIEVKTSTDKGMKPLTEEIENNQMQSLGMIENNPQNDGLNAKVKFDFRNKDLITKRLNFNSSSIIIELENEINNNIINQEAGKVRDKLKPLFDFRKK